MAVAGPLAVYGTASLGSTERADEPRRASETTVSTDIAKVTLEQVPDIVIPLKDLTGLNLPDVDLGALRSIRLPDSITIPSSIPLPGGGELKIPLAPLPSDIAAPETPAPTPATEAGAVVKQLERDTPFSMVALTSETVASAQSKVRAQREDGSWGPWFTPDAVDASPSGVDGFTGTATEPVHVGSTRAVQVLTPNADAPAPAPAEEQPAPEPAVQPAPEPGAEPAEGAPLGYVPASQSTPLAIGADDVTAVLIDPGTGPDDSYLSDVAAPLGGGPSVITRAQWGADESLRCQEPVYDDALGGATVHHTAGNNDYTKAESAGIVRAIYAYHAQTLGWCDVGYNVLVDKYGQIFEGRAGGLDRPVQGAHTGGFNENTMGIAMMGDFSTVNPPQATVDAVGKFLGWRLGKAGLDPQGTTRMWSEGTDFTFYPQGAAVDLPIIFAHRDVGNTSCPGDAGYARMNEIRQIAAANTGSGSDVLASAPAPGAPAAPAAPEAPTNRASGVVPGENIPELIGELVRLTDHSVIAQKWIAEGGDTGPLGASLSPVHQVSAGYEGAEFVNGGIYTSPNGGVWAVLGEIYRSWQAFGAGIGELGLPTSDEYPVPDGLRTDFENGSLIFNQLTGIVTKVLKTYNDNYDQALEQEAPAPAPVG
ncbi:hypothetical protein Rrhod_2045 [Rhodococcus rhodnii LMG 5362]|uniref:Cold-shock protein n=1 Tax=Rhodococcus rhodnii LMG 5362 TaxID=1273125 RepID=R7WMX3_9NOCA|nr:hypothetical protein Rrhod_2045 [Rhodococcus rhodnii LMG 5362]